MENGNPLGTLQDKLAEYAPELISCGLVGLKELVSMIQSLESPNKKDDDDAEKAERKLQRFLRGEDMSEPETTATGAVQ